MCFQGGPLHGLEDRVIAVIDRNAKALSACGSNAFRFVELTDVALIDGALIVCTVSQFSDLGVFFSQAYPRSSIRYV